MRLFVAVLPPQSALDQLAVAARRLHAFPGADGLRWTGVESWHLTLAFLGQVDPELLPGLEARFARLAHRHEQHLLRLHGGGHFGDRALWAGVDGDVRALRQLAHGVANAAVKSGIEIDARPFRPHLTLARAGARRADLRPLAGELAGFTGDPWTVGSLHLMRSHLGAGPAHYESVGEWPLRAQGKADR
ncbi:RNA 2',3'-cyclic phosphodiesterase [Streptacidiphilus monticola]|uniref:RNA 2',3'-cyclic phosphodiesterase n=1 Tax=Streptacidiphilus monticola TaxID=2161674 RepID=A0ABW1FY73_9ACTN